MGWLRIFFRQQRNKGEAVSASPPAVCADKELTVCRSGGSIGTKEGMLYMENKTTLAELVQTLGESPQGRKILREAACDAPALSREAGLRRTIYLILEKMPLTYRLVFFFNAPWLLPGYLTRVKI